jgi:hypothetical protein
MFVYIGGRAVKLLSIDEHDVCRINKGKQHITVLKAFVLLVLLTLQYQAQQIRWTGHPQVYWFY